MTRLVPDEQIAAMVRACRTDQERQVLEDMTVRGLPRTEAAQLHGLTEDQVTDIVLRVASA